MFHFGPGPKQKDYNTDTDLIRSEIGIIVDGNKSALGASTGQYVILKNSTITGKTDGLYKAAQAIPANTAIDGSYLTAVSGGLGAEVASANSSISTLNGKLTISSKTELYNSSIAKSSDSSWHSSSDNYLATLANYKKLIIQIGVHGTLYNTFEFDVADIVYASIPIQVSCYWNSDNLGMLTIQYNSLRFSVTAKTKDFVFDYALYGVA